MADSKERHEAMAQTVEMLAPLVEGNMPARTQVALAFRQVSPGEQDDFRPTFARLRAAIGEFERLPLDQRRVICNGWDARGITEPPAGEEIAEASESAPVKAFLDITHRVAGMRWLQEGDVSPVRVSIAFGTTKAEALKHLRRIEGAILDHYHTLIASESAGLDELDAETDRRLRAEARGGLSEDSAAV